jgi:hypothetical protein
VHCSASSDERCRKSGIAGVRELLAASINLKDIVSGGRRKFPSYS